ncbi:pre-mRNA-splicing regulator female-lethal(2)D isoform X2 [Drosophila novamexicana]|nr:pre-mRNA-splicing regulator female-lethal(2)D isoform X2 [Drosophila novamexicana]
MRRLANKEQEFQDYVSQIAEYKAQQAPTALALRTALLDPAVNLLFERLKKELKATKAKLEETQNELSAWKFTPDSNTGKRLMAKCRLLYQENEELGKMTSNGRLAKLETELAMQKSFSEEVKKSQSELDDFLQEIDEDVEGMQSTILFLQQELKTTRDRIQTLEKENTQLRQASSGNSPKESIDNATTTPTPATNGQSSNNNVNSSSNNNPFQQSISSSSSGPKLETIEENACLETTVSTTITTTHPADYFNGNNNNNEQQTVAPELIMPADEGSNSNGSKNGAAAARLARKRNYEEESATLTCVQETATVPVMREVSAPRTLPPKKSKLRGISTRRSSQLEGEQSLGLITPTPLVLDNAVAGMASEEFAAAMTAANVLDPPVPLIAEAITEATPAAPARILTRRRSVRMQQNGGSSIDY